MKAFVLFISLVTLLLIAPIPAVLAWEMEKPSATYTFVSDKLDTNYCNGNASVGLGIEVDTYHVNAAKYAPHDYLDLKIVATANTREILSYSFYEDQDHYSWHNLGDQCVLLGPYEDDDLIELYLPSVQFQNIRFYGGPRSAEYNLLHVSTNGFIVFDSSTWEGYWAGYWKYYPYSIPTREGPRTFIAPFWTDLHSDSSTKIKAGVVTEGIHHYLCISWENMLDTQNNHQSFQLLIGQESDFQQNPMRFQYFEVVPTANVTIGIEDPSSTKGFSINPQDIGNGKAFTIARPINYAFIGFLTIKITKTYGDSDINICEDSENIRGYNLKLIDEEPDETTMFVGALAKSGVLMIAGKTLVWLGIPLAGVILSGGMVVLETVAFLAQSMSKAEFTFQDYEVVNYAKAPAYPSWEYDASLFQPATVVDADFGIIVDWILKDKTSVQEIQIVAELDYMECDASGGNWVDKTISTASDPITLKMVPDAGNSMENARTITPGFYRAYLESYYDPQDFYLIHIGENQGIKIIMNPPNVPIWNFDLHLHDPGGTKVKSSTREAGITEYIFYTDTYEGDWFIEVNATTGYGLYNLTVSLLEIGGHGCPTLFVWNGTGYNDFGVIDIHDPTGEDLIKEVSVSAESVSIDSYRAYFRLQEGWEGLNYSHSELDQVKLYAVVNQNRYLCPLINASHSELGNVWLRLLFSDDRKVDAYLLQTVDLTFFVPYQDVEGFVFVIEGCNIEKQM